MSCASSQDTQNTHYSYVHTLIPLVHEPIFRKHNAEDTEIIFHIYSEFSSPLLHTSFAWIMIITTMDMYYPHWR